MPSTNRRKPPTRHRSAAKGGSDLFGLRSLEVSLETVGQQIVQFLPLEARRPPGFPALSSGCFQGSWSSSAVWQAAVCRSVEPTQALLELQREKPLHLVVPETPKFLKAGLSGDPSRDTQDHSFSIPEDPST